MEHTDPDSMNSLEAWLLVWTGTRGNGNGDPGAHVDTGAPDNGPWAVPPYPMWDNDDDDYKEDDMQLGCIW